MRLADRAAIVTGGAQGIGRATVEVFLAEGARVAFFDVDQAAASRLVVDASAGDRLVFVPCDLRVETEVAGAVAETLSRFGGLDILVNNAGINAYFDATTMTLEDWDSVFAIDLKAAWLCAKHTLPSLCASGRGAIINIASLHALLTFRGMFPYAAAKSGLVGLTRSLALDYGAANVRVNAVCPGYVRTRLVQEWFGLQDDPMVEQRVLEQHPLGRIGRPEEIARFVAFLASDDASYITGAALSIDGGLGARFAS